MKDEERGDGKGHHDGREYDQRPHHRPVFLRCQSVAGQGSTLRLSTVHSLAICYKLGVWHSLVVVKATLGPSCARLQQQSMFTPQQQYSSGFESSHNLPTRWASEKKL